MTQVHERYCRVRNPALGSGNTNQQAVSRSPAWQRRTRYSGYSAAHLHIHTFPHTYCITAYTYPYAYTFSSHTTAYGHTDGAWQRASADYDSRHPRPNESGVTGAEWATTTDSIYRQTTWDSPNSLVEVV